MKVAVVIPCYNESERLNIEVVSDFLNNNKDYFVLFVNDGSTDDTENFIKSNIGDRMELLSFEKNSGKAEAVRQGFLHILNNGNTDIKYIAFWDADMSVPIENILLFFKYEAIYEKSYDAIFGSRLKRLGSNITRSKYRHWLSRIFVTVILFFIRGINSYDSQCGAKVFNIKAAKRAFGEPFISRWIFDIEVQLRIKDMGLLEYPVSEWTEVAGSKINFLKTSFRVLKDIVKIRKVYR